MPTDVRLATHLRRIAKTSSPAKAAAARKNGRKGGRPAFAYGDCAPCGLTFRWPEADELAAPRCRRCKAPLELVKPAARLAARERHTYQRTHHADGPLLELGPIDRRR